MSRFIRRSVLALAVATLFSTVGLSVVQAQPKNPNDTDAAPASSGGMSLEQLLDAAGFAYQKQTFDDGSVAYRITVESNGEVSIVVASERTMGWKDSKGNDVKLVYLYRWLADLPEGGHRPEEFLAAINQLNNQRYIGRVVVNEYGVYLCNTFFLRRADTESLSDEVYLAANDAVGCLEALGELIKKLQG